MPRESKVAVTAATCRYQSSEHYGRDRRRLHLLVAYRDLADCIDLFDACSEGTREVVEALEDPPCILLGRKRWLSASATWPSEAQRHGMERELTEPAVLATKAGPAASAAVSPGRADLLRPRQPLVRIRATRGSWPARAERGRGRDQRDARAASIYAGDRHPELAEEVEVSAQPFDPVVERVIAGRGEQVEARREQLPPTLRRSGQVDPDSRRGWSSKFVQQDLEVGERHVSAPNEVDKSPPPRIIDRIRLRDQRVAPEGDHHRVAPASCADHWRSGSDCPKRKALSGSYLPLTSSNRG